MPPSTGARCLLRVQVKAVLEAVQTWGEDALAVVEAGGAPPEALDAALQRVEAGAAMIHTIVKACPLGR